MHVSKTDEVMVSKFVSAHSTTGASVRVPAFKGATHVRIRFQGEVKSDKDGLPVGIAITTADAAGMPWMLPGLPFSIPTKTQWSKFEETDMVPPEFILLQQAKSPLVFMPDPAGSQRSRTFVARGRFVFRNLNA